MADTEQMNNDLDTMTESAFANTYGCSKDTVRRVVFNDYGAQHRYDATRKRQIDEATKPVEQVPTRKWAVGDVVHPKVGPHKGEAHKVIHVHPDGSMNIVPQVNVHAQNKYRLGAARCTDYQIDMPVTDKQKAGLDKRNTAKVSKKKEPEQHVAVKNAEGKFAGRFKSQEDAEAKHKGGGVTFHPIKLKEDYDFEPLAEEEVNEVSKDLLRKYFDKAASSRGNAERSGDEKTVGKRDRGTDRAFKKLFEGQDYDLVTEERHPTDKKAYVVTAKGVDGKPGFKSSDKHGHIKFWNEHGAASARKHAGLNEMSTSALLRTLIGKTQEEEAINEISTDTARRYMRAGINQIRANRGDSSFAKKGKKRDKMIDLAAKKVVDQDVKVKTRNVNEEEINELSTKTLGRYIGKAHVDHELQTRKTNGFADTAKHYAHSGGSADDKDWARKGFVKHDTKRYNRDKGIKLAAKKLSEEENINELSQNLLHRYTTRASGEHTMAKVGERGSYNNPAAEKYWSGIARKRKAGVAQAIDKMDAHFDRNENPVKVKSRLNEGSEMIEEAKRGRPRKNPIAGADENEREHITMQLRKTVSMNGSKPVRFADNSEHSVDPSHAQKVLAHHAGLSPTHKEQFQAHIEASHDNLKNFASWKPKEEDTRVKERKLDGLGGRTVKKPLSRRPGDVRSPLEKRADLIRAIARKHGMNA